MDGPPGDEKDRIKDIVRRMKILWTAFISDFVLQRRTEEAREVCISISRTSTGTGAAWNISSWIPGISS